MNKPQNWWQAFLQHLQQLGRRLQLFFKKLGRALTRKREQAQANTPKTSWYFKVNVVLQALRSLALYLVSAVLVIGALAFGLFLGYFGGLMSHENIPTYASMKRQIENVNQSSTLYFAQSVKLADVKSDLQRTKTSYANMSPNLIKAVVATEDDEFYDHKGVVPKSLIRAVLSDVTGLGAQTGGSTLTQQLVKMQLLSSETTWRRKATEVMLALRIDKYFSKQQIIESYLNVATFGRNNAGQNIAGVETAAQGLFGTSAKNLTLPQAAFIAGLPQSPSIYTPYQQDGTVKKDLTYSMKRKNIVLFRMYRHGDISKKEYTAAKKVDLRTQFQAPTTASTSTTTYGYMYNLLLGQARSILIDQLIEQNGRKVATVKQDAKLYAQYYDTADELLKQKGYRIDSTINKKLYDNLQDVTTTSGNTFGQEYTETAFDDNLNKDVTITEKAQTGSILLDNETGAVLAFVGGRDFSDNQINHAFDTQRSPGSSIKPLIAYGPAVENKVINSQTMLADFSRNFNGYKPTDYNKTIENRFVPATEALAWSYNLPAVNLYNYLKNNTKVDPSTYMSKMGIHLTPSEYAQLGIALGGTDTGITVEQNAGAFATFANGGEHVDPYVINKITAPNGSVIYRHKHAKKKVFSKSTSYIMQQMMKNVISTGTGTQLAWQLNFNTNNVYGKTGTSNDYRDIWFVGSTPGITMATWMGYDNFYGNSHNLSEAASNTNMTYWAKMANSLYQTQPDIFKLEKTPSRPAGAQTHSVLTSTGTEAGALTISGSRVNLTGGKTSAWFNEANPAKATEKFGIGGTAENYKLFWDHYQGKSNDYGTVQRVDDNGDVIKQTKAVTPATATTDDTTTTDTAATNAATTNKDVNNSSGQNTDSGNNTSGSNNTTGGTGNSPDQSTDSTETETNTNQTTDQNTGGGTETNPATPDTTTTN